VKNRKDCEFEKKFPYATDYKVPLELAAIRGYVIGLQKSTPSELPTSSLLALNLSQHVGRRRPGELGPGGHVIWRRPRLPIRDWSVQKKQHGDVVALLSDDGREVEILEILMQVYTPPSTSDPFSNFKLPVMACAVVLLLGYQFMKQKGSGSGLPGLGGGRGKFGKSDFASLLNKKKMGGLKGKRLDLEWLEAGTTTHKT
ncbi:CIPK12, partial [Symbiodinium necroappetens]